MKDHLGTSAGSGPPHAPPELETRPPFQRNNNDRQTVITLLNDALSMELDCVLRYRRHHFASPGVGGIAGFTVAGELLAHSNEELEHADRLAARITQLGGVPVFVPRVTALLLSPQTPSLRGLLTEDLAAERTAVNTYASLVHTVSDSDPTTRRLLEDLLAQEEDHAEELEDFLRHLAITHEGTAR